LRMRDLAEHMTCDASYITALVDRLEQLGLAQRQPSATDRRVKEIALTAEGTRAANGIRSTMLTPPPEFDRLSSRERTTLTNLLAKVAPEDAGESTIFRLPVGFGFKAR
jgi:DNA-binding MarR family transcriptional regulator